MAHEGTITQEGFSLLLKWLDPDEESAARKYEIVRGRLVRMFVARGCYEAELLADRTIDRVAQKIPELNGTYVGEPAAYFYGVAKNIHLEWLRQQKRAREATAPPETGADADEAEQREAEYKCLETCLSMLSANMREMIVDYYRGEKGVKIERRREMAQRLGITTGALQIRASRVRARLHDCVRDCLAEA